MSCSPTTIRSSGLRWRGRDVFSGLGPPPSAQPDAGWAEDVARAFEDDGLFAWRYDEAVLYGWSFQDAASFARSRVDIGELRALAEHGCPPEVAHRILC